MFVTKLATIGVFFGLVVGCTQSPENVAPTLDMAGFLATCKKAVADKDKTQAAKDCPFVEQWFAHVAPDSVQHAQALESLGDFLGLLNQGALNQYAKAVAILEKNSPDSAELTSARIKLATSQSASGKWQEAEILFRKAVRSFEATKDSDIAELSDVWNRLGVVQLKQMLLADAEQSLRRALEIRETHFKSDDGRLGEIYNNLGFMYQAMGKHQDAESFYRKAVINQESAQLTPYPALYDSINNLAVLLQKQAKLPEAEAYLKKALTVAEKAFGKDSVQYASALNNLGVLSISGKNYVAGEKSFSQALTIRQKALGNNHIETAEAANNLAVALANQGKREQALPIMRYATAITEVNLGGENPTTLQRWESLANLNGALSESPTKNSGSTKK